MTQQLTSLSESPMRHECGVHSDLNWFDYEGSKIAYRDEAGQVNFPVVLCLHAVGHGSRDFDAFVNAFRSQFRIITIDWPGQGRSENFQEAASIQTYTRLVSAFLEWLEIRRNVIVIGNSIGGGVALNLAIKANEENKSELIKALVISNPGGVDKGGVLAKVFLRWMKRKMHAGTVKDAKFKDWFENYYLSVLPSTAAAEQRVRIVNSAYEIAPILEQAWTSFGESKNDLKHDLAKITQPVLIAWAKQDKYVQWSRCKHAIKKLPNCKLEFFNAGHTPFLEQPEEFNKSFSKFVLEIRMGEGRAQVDDAISID